MMLWAGLNWHRKKSSFKSVRGEEFLEVLSDCQFHNKELVQSTWAWRQGNTGTVIKQRAPQPSRAVGSWNNKWEPGDRTGQLLRVTVVGPPGVVATLGDPAVLARVHEAVRTVVQLRLTADTLPVAVTVCRISHNAALRLARVILLPDSLLRQACSVKQGKFTSTTKEWVARLVTDRVTSVKQCFQLSTLQNTVVVIICTSSFISHLNKS
jgi:hypothetical protein